jgi:hypothetical protein
MVRVRVPKWPEFNNFGIKCQSCRIWIQTLLFSPCVEIIETIIITILLWCGKKLIWSNGISFAVWEKMICSHGISFVVWKNNDIWSYDIYEEIFLMWKYYCYILMTIFVRVYKQKNKDKRLLLKLDVFVKLLIIERHVQTISRSFSYNKC